MKAVMYGGGNIGRGFIGMLFQQSGYEVTFIDIDPSLVEELNERQQYPVRVVSSDGYQDIRVDGVQAVNGRDTDRVARIIAEADIMATAVGVNVLKYIVPNLVAGIRERFETNDKPLNIIICENLIEIDQQLKDPIKSQLTDKEKDVFTKRIGLVRASIGRMVPVQTEVMKDGDNLRVCVEPYGWLPVEKEAFKGPIPEIKGMVPYSSFDFYTKRKLFIHNMGHAVCAYLGLFSGYEFIYEAIDDPEIYIIVKGAMTESAKALSHAYSFSLNELLDHVDDLLLRFTNRALKDTCTRVGADPARKLAPSDRLVGAALLCQKSEVTPAHLTAGIAAAVYRYLDETSHSQNLEQCKRVLNEISKLDDPSLLVDQITARYTLMTRGASVQQLRKAIMQDLLANKKDVI